MASYSFACPGCEKVLRTSALPTAGKKIRCPACGETFVPEVGPEENAFQDAPRVKARAKSAAKDDADNEAAPSPKKKSKRSEADNDDGDEDARPAKKKKKGKDSNKAGGKMTVLLLAAGGAALLVSVGLCGVGAFVWPGFMVSTPPEKKLAQSPPPKVEEKKTPEVKPPEKKPEVKPPVSNKDDLTAYVAGGSPFLVGLNTKQLRDANKLEEVIKSIESVPGVNKMPDVLRTIYTGSDKMLVSSMPAAGKPKVIVAILLTGADVSARLKQRPEFGAEGKLNGKYAVFRPVAKAELSPVIAFPTERILIMSDLNDEELGGFLDSAAPIRFNASPAAALAKTVEQASLWGAWTFDNDARALLNVPPNNFTKGNKELELAIQAVGKAKGATLTANPAQGTAWDFRVGIECADAADAKYLKDGAEAARVLLGFFVGASKDIPPAVTRDLGTLAIQNQATTTALTMQVSIESIAGLAMKMGGPAKKPIDFPPPKDGGKPLGPVSKPGLNYKIAIPSGETNERAFLLKGGKLGIVTVGCEFTPGQSTDMHIYVLRGNSGEDVIASHTKGGPNPNLRFTPPVGMEGVYRIRVVNRGKATPTSCVVSFIQFP